MSIDCKHKEAYRLFETFYYYCPDCGALANGSVWSAPPKAVEELVKARDAWRGMAARAEVWLDSLSHASATQRRSAWFLDRVYAARTELGDMRGAVLKLPRAKAPLIIQGMGL